MLPMYWESNSVWVHYLLPKYWESNSVLASGPGRRETGYTAWDILLAKHIAESAITSILVISILLYILDQ